MTDWLDELCDEYEREWNRSELEMPSRILRFLTPRGLSPSQRADALSAIVEIDIERDWIWWRKWLIREADNRTASDLLTQFARNARTVHCVEPASYFALGDREFIKCQQVECKARGAWGDSPHYSDFRVLADLSFDWPAARHRAVIHKGTNPSTWETPLHGLTEFGRQRSSEKPSQRVMFGLPLNRIVISSREDVRVSRQHFRVQILSPEYAVVSNESQLRPILFADGRRLLHQESIAVHFPFQMRLEDLVIECF